MDTALPAVTLVTGPARSGKSEWAERLAADSGHPVIYVATAHDDPTDAEWSARIAAHRQRRPATWVTVCAPQELAAVIAAPAHAAHCLLIESLGTWVANLLTVDAGDWRDRVLQLHTVLAQSAAPRILVAEETGWGVIPAYPSGRQFRDRLGQLVRQLAPRCATTYLVASGHALNLTRLAVPLP